MQHGEEVRATSVHVALPPVARSARAARRFLDRTLGCWDCRRQADVVTLLADELVTNVVTHTGSSAELTVARRPGTLRVEVTDTGAGQPTVQPASPDAQSGRGLAIVEALADRWGVDPEPRGHGKTVWFEVEA